MSSSVKKTLYFAVPTLADIGRIDKTVILEDIDLTSLNSSSDNTNSINQVTQEKYNVINIKVLPRDEGILEFDFEELEEILAEQSKEYQEKFIKRYPGSIILSGEQVHYLTERFELDREKRLTAHLSDEQKIVRSALYEFKKRVGLKDSEASFVTNIFDDILSLKLIDEDTIISKQRKSINQVFPDKRYMVDLIIQEIEDLQSKIVYIRSPDASPQVVEDFYSQLKIQWPDWQVMAEQKKEEQAAAEALAQSQKRGRGRPKKHVF